MQLAQFMIKKLAIINIIRIINYESHLKFSIIIPTFNPGNKYLIVLDQLKKVLII